MKENAYVEFMKLLTKGGSSNGLKFGKVVSGLPNITIQTGENQLDNEDIIVSDYLMADNYLKSGDTVSLMKLDDGQLYFVITKVVRP